MPQSEPAEDRGPLGRDRRPSASGAGHLPERETTREVPELRGLEALRDGALSVDRTQQAAVRGDESRGIGTAVVERVEREVGHPGRRPVASHPHDAGLVEEPLHA